MGLISQHCSRHLQPELGILPFMQLKFITFMGGLTEWNLLYG